MTQSLEGQQDPKRSTLQRREAAPSAGGLSAPGMTSLLLHLQRTAGNRAVNGLLQRWAANAPAQIQRRSETPEIGPAGGPISDGLSNRINARRGAGSALDAGIRARMEDTLDTPFDQVRVHTDGESHALNRSVDARAFTVGSDVFLGPDAAPSDTGLLAHELTHVAQQGRMSGSGPLTVGPAGDSYEQEAEAVESAVPVIDEQLPSLTGAGDYQVDRQQVADKVTIAPHDQAQRVSEMEGSRPVQRKRVAYPTPFMGGAMYNNKSTVSFDPNGALFVEGNKPSSTVFPGGNTADVSIKSGAKGTARIYMHMYVFEENGLAFSDTNWEQIYFVEWNVSALDGKLTIDANGAKTINAKTGDPYTLSSLDSLDTAAGADYVRMTPTVKSGGGSESVAPAGIGSTLNSPGNSLSIPFTLNIHVTNIPERDVTVTFEKAQELKTHEVLFEDPEQDTISPKQFDQLMGWYKDTLSQITRDSVQAGSEPIVLAGHASTTGGSKHNLDLSDRRMKAVLDDLSKFAGNKAKFEYRSTGDLEAHTGPNVERQAERKVTVQVFDTPSKGADVP